MDCRDWPAYWRPGEKGDVTWFRDVALQLSDQLDSGQLELVGGRQDDEVAPNAYSFKEVGESSMWPADVLFWRVRCKETASVYEIYCVPSDGDVQVELVQ